MPVHGSHDPFPILPDEEALENVRAAVAARQPYSLIRIGDGESVVLSVGDSTWLQDLAYLASHWGAEQVTLADVEQVRDDLLAALRGADVVGVRGDVVNVAAPADLLELSSREAADVIRSTFPLRAREREILSPLAARRLAIVNRTMGQLEWDARQRFCSAWIHWELLASGVLDEILRTVPRVALVTSRPELEHIVSRRFGVPVSVVRVPDKYVDAPVSGAHVPDRYRRIRSELVFPEGTLALVGAGIPGKAYCQWLKEAGCVAIDIGSVLDAWIGRPSRPLVLQSRFRVPGGTHVPDELRLRTDQERTDRTILPRWKPGVIKR